MKSARERMDIISAYREVGSYRGAAAISGTTAKTVKRVIARHESGGVAPARQPRARNYDSVTELVSERVEKTKGRIAAKRLLPLVPAPEVGKARPKLDSFDSACTLAGRLLDRERAILAPV